MYFFFFQRVPAKESPASNRTWLNSSRRTWLLSWSIKLATIQTGTALNQYLSAHISPYMGEMRERKKGVNYWSIIDLYSFCMRIVSRDRITIFRLGNEWPNGSCSNLTPTETTWSIGKKRVNCDFCSSEAKSWGDAVRNFPPFATRTVTKESQPTSGSSV